jgi:hypothetical protein
MNQVFLLLLSIDMGYRGYELRGGINSFVYESYTWFNNKNTPSNNSSLSQRPKT